jgi:hypothetical protein
MQMLVLEATHSTNADLKCHTLNLEKVDSNGRRGMKCANECT